MLKKDCLININQGVLVMVDNKNTEEYLKKKVVQEIDSIIIPKGLKDEIWQGIQSKRKTKFSQLLPYLAMIACLVILIPLGLNLIALSEGKTTTKVSNLEVFARIYGYVRYFHPSDEVADLDWDQFAIYGVNRIKQTKNDKELLTVLNELFLPIAPTMSITSEKDVKENTMKVPKNAVLVMWQHQLEGDSFDYSSERIYSEDSESIKLFNKTFKYGENTIEKKIGNINVSIPTILYSSAEKTVGSTKESTKKFEKLERKMQKYLFDHDINYENEDVRIANVMISWNIFEHFYPYFDELQLDWLKQLAKSLTEMKKVKSESGTYKVMRNMLVNLKDGNIGYILDYPRSFATKLPFSVKLIDGKLVVTFSKVKGIQPGDTLVKMNGKDALKEFNRIADQISGTKQWKETQAAYFLLINPDQSEAKITLQRKGKFISATAPYNDQPQKYIDFSFDPKENFKELEQGIYYINFFNRDFQLDDSILAKLTKAKGIVVDMRGASGEAPLTFLSHLTDQKLASAKFLQLQMILPDHDQANTYKDGSWSIKPQQPKINGKAVFLTDACAIGYAETIMGIVEHYKLGEIVGEPTAGTNGNVVQMFLPGGVQFLWTGLRVEKHDGSQHHDVGIQPTVPVYTTLKGITENIDEPLAEALKLLKQ